MRTIPLDTELRSRVAATLAQAPLFQGLNAEQLDKVVGLAVLMQFDAGETLVRQGDASEGMFVVVRGEAAVSVAERRTGEPVQVSVIRAPETAGEVGLLLGEPRMASVTARGTVLVVSFSASTFRGLFLQVPAFGMAVAQSLARRLVGAQRDVSLPTWSDAAPVPSPDVVSLLPLDFIERHRVLPLSLEGTSLTLGFVDSPDAATLDGARRMVPSLEITPVQIRQRLLDEVLRERSGIASWSSGLASRPPAEAAATAHAAPQLDRLLRRMVAEGASDLHLSAGHRPRWRIDGAVREIGDVPVLGGDEVAQLLDGAMDARSRAALADNDCDFAYPIEGLARFRVNMFRDQRGVSAVLRVIPAKILTVEQLGLPPAVEALCRQPKGLVLVTGPTGSGKSTTLAAMIDAINRTRDEHILTLEDPVEFVHRSQRCLVNQREVGPHTKSFARALKAALREDPDIVLVGEMRDLETVSLAMETANTGHLVFGTLHTSTAIGTVDRIINLFAPEQQPQMRATLSETLRGVVAQTLCKKIGGGRVAALEVLMVNAAVSNLIREGKSHQIASMMSVGRAAGNQLLNDELQRLVSTGVVAYEEASAKAVDKADLARRCGKEPPEKDKR